MCRVSKKKTTETTLFYSSFMSFSGLIWSLIPYLAMLCIKEYKKTGCANYRNYRRRMRIKIYFILAKIVSSSTEVKFGKSIVRIWVEFDKKLVLGISGLQGSEKWHF